jgi:hypothetical protein
MEMKIPAIVLDDRLSLLLTYHTDFEINLDTGKKGTGCIKLLLTSTTIDNLAVANSSFTASY